MSRVYYIEWDLTPYMVLQYLINTPKYLGMFIP